MIFTPLDYEFYAVQGYDDDNDSVKESEVITESCQMVDHDDILELSNTQEDKWMELLMDDPDRKWNKLNSSAAKKIFQPAEVLNAHLFDEIEQNDDETFPNSYGYGDNLEQRQQVVDERIIHTISEQIKEAINASIIIFGYRFVASAIRRFSRRPISKKIRKSPLFSFKKHNEISKNKQIRTNSRQIKIIDSKFTFIEWLITNSLAMNQKKS